VGPLRSVLIGYSDESGGAGLRNQKTACLSPRHAFQTNVDLAESLDAKPTFSCPEVLLRGGGAKIVETADLIANMDSGARIENR
jgi:hypothetical protein